METIGEYEEKDKGTVRVIAHVKTPDLYTSTAECIKNIENDAVICTLIPGRQEQKNVEIVFSPLNQVSLEVQGSIPVSFVGRLENYDCYEEDEEEDEYYLFNSDEEIPVNANDEEEEAPKN